MVIGRGYDIVIVLASGVDFCRAPTGVIRSPLPASVLDCLEQSPFGFRPPLAAVAGEVGDAGFLTAAFDARSEFGHGLGAFRFSP